MEYVCMPRGFGTLEEFFEALTFISLTDDTAELLSIINHHRDWKFQKIEEKKGGKTI